MTSLLHQSSPDLKFTSQFPWPLSPLLYPKIASEGPVSNNDMASKGPASNDGFSSLLSGMKDDTDLNLADIWNKFSQQLVEKMGSTGGRSGQEKELYTPIAVLLNILSLAQYSHLARRDENKSKPLLWIINNLRTLEGDILRTLVQPDIIVGHVDCVDIILSYLKGITSEDKESNERLEFNINFFRLASTVEVKTNLSDHSQLLHYLSVQLRYRLDLSFVYGLHARYQDYRIAFLSPSRVAHSANFSWERLDALAHYVAVVYRHEQTAHDEFNQVEGTNCSWTIEVDNKTYIGEQFFASFPLGRTTVSLIVVDMSGEHDLLFLKTYYVNSTSRFREEQLYKVAHGNYEKSGYIQGLALLVSAKEYANKYQLHGGSMEVPRTKCVVVLGSIGKPLSTCRSVLSLLKVIYDATVTLEEMAKNGVMHRDINRGNIMCNAMGVSKLHGEKVRFKDSPYIERTLYDIKKGNLEKIGVCHALVADLNHAENMAQNDGATGRGRTGTAMYIATELAGNEYEYDDPIVDSSRVDLLTNYLKGVFKKTGAKFSDSFHKVVDDIGTSMSYSTTEEVKQLEQRQNLPRHDVESLFWVLIFALLRALPEGAEDHECTAKAQNSYNVMVYHFLTRSMDITTDARVQLLRGSLRWKAVLHTKLYPICGMLNAMGNLFSIDWSSRIHDKRNTFIHEAFRCILLGEIDRLICDGDVNIHTELPRDAELNKDTRLKSHKSLKRRCLDKIFQHVSQSKVSEVNKFLSERKAIMEDWINDELWMSMKAPENAMNEGVGNQPGLFIPAGENPIEFEEEKEW